MDLNNQKNEQQISKVIPKQKRRNSEDLASNKEDRLKILKERMQFEKKALEESAQTTIVSTKVVTNPTISNSDLETSESKLRELQKAETECLVKVRTIEKELGRPENSIYSIQSRLDFKKTQIEEHTSELNLAQQQLDELNKKQEVVRKSITSLKMSQNQDEVALMKHATMGLMKNELNTKIHNLRQEITETKAAIKNVKSNEEVRLWYYSSSLFEFFHAHKTHFLVQSDFVSLVDIERHNSGELIITKEFIKDNLKGLIEEKFHSTVICPVDAAGSKCNNPNCPFSHFSSLQKSNQDKVVDFLRSVATYEGENLELFNFVAENGLDAALDSSQYLSTLSRIVEDCKCNKVTNNKKIPVKAPFAAYSKNIETIRALVDHEKSLKRTFYTFEDKRSTLSNTPQDISLWISTIVSTLPDKLDAKNMRSAISSFNLVREALMFNPDSEILLTVNAELFCCINYNAKLRIREMFSQTLTTIKSSHILWTYFTWETDLVIAEKIMISTIEKSPEADELTHEGSYFLLNLLANLLRIGTETALDYVGEKIGLRSAQQSSLLDKLLPIHYCCLILHFCVVLKLGRLPSDLFYDSPMHFLCVSQPFLINWNLVPFDDSNNLIIEKILSKSIGIFSQLEQLDILQCLLRNYAGFRKYIGVQVNQLVTDLFLDMTMFDHLQEFRLLKLIILTQIDTEATMGMASIIMSHNCNEDIVERLVLMKLGLRYGVNPILQLIHQEDSSVKDFLGDSHIVGSGSSVDFYELYLYLCVKYANGAEPIDIKNLTEEMRMRDVQKSLLWTLVIHGETARQFVGARSFAMLASKIAQASVSVSAKTPYPFPIHDCPELQPRLELSHVN